MRLDLLYVVRQWLIYRPLHDASLNYLVDAVTCKIAIGIFETPGAQIAAGAWNCVAPILGPRICAIPQHSEPNLVDYRKIA